MDDEDIFIARCNAAAALSQLLFKDSSVEVGVRSVLRIAEHKGLTWWKIWATMQLLHFASDEPSTQLSSILDREFPTEKGQQRALLLEQHGEEYRAMRLLLSKGSDGGALYNVTDLAGIEKTLVLAEASYCQDADSELASDIRDYVTILQRIKSRVQAFLTAVEMGETPSLPPAPPPAPADEK
jgi:hypothetical protein